MEEIDGFGKHGQVCPLSRRKLEPACSLMERLLEIGGSSVPEGDGCDCLLVQGASFPQLSYGLEHNLTEFRVDAGNREMLQARWTR
jgi:hypothetical protein